MSLLLRQWPLLLVYLQYNSLFILMMKPLLLTTSGHSSLVLPFSGVILVSPLMSLLSSIICFSGFHVIPFGLSHIYTLFPLRDVLFCILLSSMLLFVFPLCLLALQLRIIGVARKGMVFSFQFSFIGFCQILVQRIFLHPSLFRSSPPQVPPFLGKEWLR